MNTLIVIAGILVCLCITCLIIGALLELSGRDGIPIVTVALVLFGIAAVFGIIFGILEFTTEFDYCHTWR